MESRKPPDTQFKIMVIRVPKKLSENFNKEIVNIKKGHRNNKKASRK